MFIDNEILLTGGTGFLGENLKKLLELDGWKVFSPTSKEINLLNPSQVSSIFNQRKYVAIIHCAIYGRKFYESSDPLIYKNNLAIFENLYKYIGNTNLFINVDSGVSLGDDLNDEILSEKELGKYIPSKPYAYSKYCIAKRIYSDSKSINLRLWGCFGPNEGQDRFFTANIQNYIYRRPIQIFQDRKMDFIYVEDFYKILKSVIMQQKNIQNEDINCVYKEKHTLLSLARAINNLSDYNVDINIDRLGAGRSYCGQYTERNFKFKDINQRIYELYKLTSIKN